MISQRVFNKFNKDARQRRAVGLLVAQKVGDQVIIGWSKCWLAKDRYDSTEAHCHALNRIRGFPDYPPVKLPSPVSRDMPRFIERAARFYKVLQESITIAGVAA